MKASFLGFARLIGLSGRQLAAVLALMLVLSQVLSLISLSPPLLLLHIFDNLLEGGRIETLAVLITLFLVVNIVGVVLQVRFREIIRSVSVVLERRLFLATLRVGIRLARTGRPEQATLALANMSVLRNFLAGSTLFDILALAMVPLMFACMFILHQLLGWIAILSALVVALLSWNTHRQVAGPAAAAAQASGEADSMLARHLQRRDEVEGLGLLPGIVRHWMPRRRDALNQAQVVEQRSSVMDSIAEMSSRLFGISAMAVAAWLVIHDRASPGIFTATIMLFTRMMFPFSTLAAQWSRMSAALVAVRGLRETMALVPEQGQWQRSGEDSDLHVVGLRLEVPDTGRLLVDDLHLHARPGSVIAITGRNAAGKSTLLRALIGLVQPAMGGVMFEGWPMHLVDRAVIGPRIGFMSQRAQLMAGTIMENICRFTDDTEGALKAARLSGAHEMIGRLPAGYSTPAEAGAGLSGGQQRQVALARALYGEPGLVVLDEPEVALDEPAVAALVTAVAMMKQRGAIVFLVTHDLRRWRGVADVELRLGAEGKWGAYAMLAEPALQAS